jgi:hypothetical protein
MKPKQSVYSKMYLVTPNVYDKVLQNLEEKLKKSTAELNIEKQTEASPSEKILEDISTQEVQSESIDNPEIVDNPEFIDPDPSQEAEPTFGVSEGQVEPGQVVEQGEQVESEIEQPESSNPLTTSCAQPQVQDQFIPLIRTQGVKKQRAAEGKIKKTLIVPKIVRQIPQREKLIVPKIVKQIPQIQRVQQEASFDPNIKRVQVTRPEPMAMIKDIKIRPRKFVCNVCLKGFATNYHLNRHIASVHKNLSNIQPAALPDEDIQMGGPSLTEEEPMERPVFPKPSTSKQFQSWKASQEKASTPLKGKRTQGDAKLKYTPRPTKTRPSDDWFESWEKK